MSDGPSPAVLAAAQNRPILANEDRLQKLRDAVATVRDLEKVKADQEAALKETNKALQEQYYKTLPDLMDEVGVPEITLEAEGNMPQVTAKASPYYHANIAADWEPVKRQEAFEWLDKEGHGDLIKTEVVISFPREERKAAVEFAKKVRGENLNVGVTVGEAVHWATLTAWLKEMVEKHSIMPPLEILGATVGRVVKLKAKD